MLLALSSSSIAATRRLFISFAALFVKVMASICQGAQGAEINSGRISSISSLLSPAALSSCATFCSVRLCGI